MARTALRLRTTKEPSAAKKPSATVKKVGTAKKASTAQKSGTAKKPSAGKKAGSAKKPSAAKKAATTKKSATETRPLPLPLRLLAMLCAFVVMVAFAVVLARLTLAPSPASVAIAHTNLHPGRTLKAYLDQPALRDAVKQIGGNLLLGVPFGVLVPVLAPRARGVLRVLVLTAVVMLLVEFAQGALVEGRSFDIDDVILNTSGALIGYALVGRRLGRTVHARVRT